MDEVKRASGRSRSKPPAVSVDAGEVGPAERAVEALLAELRVKAGWSAADEVLGQAALSLGRGLDSGPLMSRGAISRELRNTIEKLPRASSPDNPIDRLLAQRAARQAEAAQRWAGGEHEDNGSN